MKYGILSLLVAILGLGFLYYVNAQFANLVGEITANQQEMEPHLIIAPKIYKMTALILGLIGFFFGMKGIKIIRKASMFGMTLSLILIGLSFIPIWKYLVL